MMPPVRNPARNGRREVGVVVGAYAVLAALWILFSDKAIGNLFSDPAALVRASMLKGWLFVAVTSALLYALMRRMVRRLGKLDEECVRTLNLLSIIADASPDAIYAKDAQGRYLLCNRAACEFTGRVAQQMLGRDDRELFPTQQAESIMADDRRIMAAGQPETREERLDTAAGPRVFLTTKGPLRDGEGRVAGTVGISRDITERKHGEDDLRQLAEDLGATLRAIPDLLFEMDADGIFVSVTATQSELPGQPRADLVGRGVQDVLPQPAAQTVMTSLAAAGEAGTDFGRTIALAVAGATRWYELSVAAKPTSAVPRRFVVLARDVTARRAAEQALQEQADELRRRNDELERFNRAMVGRELEMIELKRRIDELSRRLGDEPPFAGSAVASADVPGAPSRGPDA